MAVVAEDPRRFEALALDHIDSTLGEERRPGIAEAEEWQRSLPTQVTQRLSAVLRRGLDRLLYSQGAHGWKPEPGSTSERDFKGAREWWPTGLMVLLEMPVALTMASSAHVAALAEMLDVGLLGPALASPARAVVEHAAFAHWIFQPGLSTEERVARAWLAMSESYELFARAAGHAADSPEKVAALQQQFADASVGFPNAVKQSKRGEIIGLAGESRKTTTDMVADYSRYAGLTRSPYPWLSAHTHPNFLASRQSRFQYEGRLYMHSERQDLGDITLLAAEGLRNLCRVVRGWYRSLESELPAWQRDNYVAIRSAIEI